MIIYCFGDATRMKNEFEAAASRRDALVAQNDEVVATTESDGRGYVAEGEIPFGNMTVAEYVSYNRSTALGRRIRDEETKYYAKLFGMRIALRRKLKTLDSIDFRAVQILASYDMAVREVYLRFDSLAYSKRAAAKLGGLLRKLSKYFNVYAAVSDYRFAPRGATVRYYGEVAVTLPISRFTARRRPRSAAARLSLAVPKDCKIRALVEVAPFSCRSARPTAAVKMKI